MRPSREALAAGGTAAVHVCAAAVVAAAFAAAVLIDASAVVVPAVVGVAAREWNAPSMSNPLPFSPPPPVRNSQEVYPRAPSGQAVVTGQDQTDITADSGMVNPWYATINTSMIPVKQYLHRHSCI